MSSACRFLNDGDRERIHKDSLRILSETGVRFMSGKALDILRKNGARIDAAERIARIPPDMVEEALGRAPKRFTLGARNHEHDFHLPSSYTGYTLDGAATFAMDFRTGERRNATIDDLVASLRIFEELPLGKVVWPNVVPCDLPAHAEDMGMTLLSLIHSSKHIQNELHNVADVPLLMEALAAVVGSEDEVRKRKVFSVCYCTIPPLTHDEAMCEAYLELSQFHVPILSYPMPACGSTGPASLRTNIALANAEGLSTVVLFQFAAPGTPIIFGHATGIMNFATGGFLEGAPEATIMNASLGEMARFYSLPNTQAGCLTEAKTPGPQAVMEKMMSTMPLVLSGVDVINGIGEVETSQMLVREQLVVDHEIATFCRRMKEGVNTSAERDLLADVAAARPGGHFLMQDSTVDACRSGEFLSEVLGDRGTFEQWTESGRPDIYSRARVRVEEVLGSEQKNPLPDGTRGKVERLLERLGS